LLLNKARDKVHKLSEIAPKTNMFVFIPVRFLIKYHRLLAVLLSLDVHRIIKLPQDKDECEYNLKKYLNIFFK
jgi:hypothetical protein